MIFSYEQILRRKVKEEKELLDLQTQVDEEESKLLVNISTPVEPTNPNSYNTLNSDPTLADNTDPSSSVLNTQYAWKPDGHPSVLVNHFREQNLQHNDVLVGEGSSTAMSLSSPSGGDTMLKQRLILLTGELKTLKQRYHKSLMEEQQEKIAAKLEIKMKPQIQNWMIQWRRLLWPTRQEDILLGQPVQSGVPSGVRQAIVEAESAGISSIHDVSAVIDYFEYLSWCYQCLLLLRAPAPTPMLRKLIEKARAIKCTDERLFKVLSAILSRARYDEIRLCDQSYWNNSFAIFL